MDVVYFRNKKREEAETNALFKGASYTLVLLSLLLHCSSLSLLIGVLFDRSTMKKQASSNTRKKGISEPPGEPALIPETDTEKKSAKKPTRGKTTHASSGQAKHNLTRSEDQLKKLALAVLSKAKKLNTDKYKPEEWKHIPERFVSTIMHAAVADSTSHKPECFYRFYYDPNTQVIGEKPNDGMIEMTLQKRSNFTYFVAQHLEKKMLRLEFSLFEQEDIFLTAKNPTLSRDGVLAVFAKHVCSKVNTTSETVIGQLKKLDEDQSNSFSVDATVKKILACAKEMKALRKMESLIDGFSFHSPQAYILASKLSRKLDRRTSEVGDCLAACEPLFQVDLELTTERANHLQAKATLKLEQYGKVAAPRTKAQQAAEAIRKKDERQNLVLLGTKATLAAEKKDRETTLRDLKEAKVTGRHLSDKYN